MPGIEVRYLVIRYMFTSSCKDTEAHSYTEYVPAIDEMKTTGSGSIPVWLDSYHITYSFVTLASNSSLMAQFSHF